MWFRDQGGSEQSLNIEAVVNLNSKKNLFLSQVRQKKRDWGERKYLSQKGMNWLSKLSAGLSWVADEWFSVFG